ncbi:MAG: DHH family phosphoesterase [Promethearchaeia archaeon]
MIIEDKIKKLIKYLRNKQILILTHHSADIDALSSCYLFHHVLKEIFEPKTLDLYFSSISRTTRQFMDQFISSFPNFSFDMKKTIDQQDYDIIIIIDTNNLNQVEGISFSNDPSNLDYLFIDHHANLGQQTIRSISEYNIIDDYYSSASEIIFEIVKVYQLNLSIPLKFLTISGILVDSGFFKFANNHTIHTCSQLLDEDFTIYDVYSMLEFEEDISQKIARIKGLQRLNLIRHGDYLLGITHIGSFESVVASNIIKNGLDIIIVYSKKAESRFRITTRAKRKICKSTELHLGKLLNETSKKYHANGGGHDGAASMNLRKTSEVEIEKLLDELIQQIKQILNES